MGKERLIESTRQGIKSTKDFVKRQPAFVACEALSGGLALSSLGL